MGGCLKVIFQIILFPIIAIIWIVRQIPVKVYLSVAKWFLILLVWPIILVIWLFKKSSRESKPIYAYTAIGIIGIFIVAAFVGSLRQAALNAEATRTARTEVAQRRATQSVVNTENAFSTQTATLWTSTPTSTPTMTPTSTFTPTVTNTPTSTFTPTVTNTPTITKTPTVTFTPSITSSPTITNTPEPTQTSRPTTVPLPTDIPSGRNYYVNGTSANIRTCPETNCERVVTLSFGDAIEIIDASVEGEDVLSGTRWMQGVYNGQIVYIHSDLVSSNRPSTAAPQPVTSNNSSSSSSTGNTSSSSNTTSSGGPGGDTSIRPANCTQAREMGLTAEQAAQWSHLDRDGDGLACYGT